MPPLYKVVLFLLVFSPVLLSNSIKAQRVSPGQPQAKPDPKAAASSDKAIDYSQEAFVIEQIKTSYRFEKDGTGQREFGLRVKVQNEGGVENFGQLVFAYSSANEQLEIDNVSVHKPNGSVVTASASDVQDLTGPISREAPVYTDVRQKHVTVRGLGAGDVLKYHVTWRVHTPLAPNHFWLDYDFARKNVIVLDEQLQVDVLATVLSNSKTNQVSSPLSKITIRDVSITGNRRTLSAKIGMTRTPRKRRKRTRMTIQSLRRSR